MTFLSLIFIFLFSSLLNFTSIPTTQAKARDTERKNDINSLHAQLEIYFNEHGDYPTIEGLTVNYDQKLPGLDRETLVDPSGKTMNKGGYEYSTTDCTALGCSHYKLHATLESSTGAQSSSYTKESLN